MSDIFAERQVAAIIQRVYGDVTQTMLDHDAAREIVAGLRALGWVSPQELGAVVAAAGGRVEVPKGLLADDREVRVWDSPGQRSTIVETLEGYRPEWKP